MCLAYFWVHLCPKDIKLFRETGLKQYVINHISPTNFIVNPEFTCTLIIFALLDLQLEITQWFKIAWVYSVGSQETFGSTTGWFTSCIFNVATPICQGGHKERSFYTSPTLRHKVHFAFCMFVPAHLLGLELTMSNVLPLPVSFSMHVWMPQEHHQVTGDTSQLSPLSLNPPSLSSTVFHISDETSKANHCPVKRWMGVQMLSCIWCDQTTDERDEMLRVGDTAEVPCRLPNSFPAPSPLPSYFTEIPCLL